MIVKATPSDEEEVDLIPDGSIVMNQLLLDSSCTADPKAVLRSCSPPFETFASRKSIIHQTATPSPISAVACIVSRIITAHDSVHLIVSESM
jgi:hypothetical protein